MHEYNFADTQNT